MTVSFDGYHANTVTFEAASGVIVGLPVVMSANGKVANATSAFCGVCKSLKNGYAAVQLDGYVRLPYTGSIAVGYKKLVVDTGKIKVDATNGREHLVIDVDSTTNTAGIIL